MTSVIWKYRLRAFLVWSGLATPKVGILVIGSLEWDDHAVRKEWRTTRLVDGGRVRIRVPIHYGRAASTRGNTFTMCYGGAEGSALVIPCRRSPRDLAALALEAEWLWRAEMKGLAPAGSIHGKIGTVCVLFRDAEVTGAVAADWSRHYNRTTPPSVPFVNNGRLCLGWPLDEFGLPADFDILLGTATMPNRAGGRTWLPTVGCRTETRNISSTTWSGASARPRMRQSGPG